MSYPERYSISLLHIYIYISLVYGVLLTWKLREGPITRLIMMCMCLLVAYLFITRDT